MSWLALLLSAPLVVLDPGHGGRADGVSVAGVREADVTLQVARAAARALRAQGFEVRLTRRGDEKLGLGARVQRGAGAAAFVSLHVNSAPGTRRRGTETYVAAIRGIDAAAVSPGEAAVDLRGADAAGVPGIVEDLRRRDARARAAILAGHIQAEVSAVGGMAPDRGIRQAPFAVVQNADVPAALVEMGFMTHPEQRRLLANAEHQAALGRALARAIGSFLQSTRAAPR